MPNDRKLTLSHLSAGLDDDELCELATECDECGPFATINGLIEGLLLRHADDCATVAALLALQHFHLPALVDVLTDE